MRALVAGSDAAGLQGIDFGIEPIGAIDELERQWRRLEAVASPSFFLSWHWIGTLLEMAPADARPLLLRGTADGRTVALAVLGDAELRRHRIIRARRWVLNATGDPALDCIHLEHNALLADPRIGWDGLLDAFAAAKNVDEIGLPGVGGPPSRVLVEERGLLRKEASESSFSIDLGALSDSDGDVAAILSHNARSQLRRALRRLDPLRIDEAATTGEALAHFRTMKALHIRWWRRRGVPHAFTHEFFERFHERLIERGFADGAVQLLRVSSGDRTIGVLYNFKRGNRVYAYQSGFTLPEAGERPGVVTHALAIKRAWQQGAEVYDFMAGENRLKRSFSNCVDTLSWTVIQKPHLRFRAEHRATSSSRRTASPHGGLKLISEATSEDR
jgi:CelD/BcsL family acetyltransferase involved in cellulose biosynthesis